MKPKYYMKHVLTKYITVLCHTKSHKEISPTSIFILQQFVGCIMSPQSLGLVISSAKLELLFFLALCYVPIVFLQNRTEHYLFPWINWVQINTQYINISTNNYFNSFKSLLLYNSALFTDNALSHLYSIIPWALIKKNMSSYQYRKTHCGDTTILRPSYLQNGISFTGKTTYLYWIRALIISRRYVLYMVANTYLVIDLYALVLYFSWSQGLYITSIVIDMIFYGILA